jgi:hypothetical protein
VAVLTGILLLNPSFEESVGGLVGGPGTKGNGAGWAYEFAGPTQSYIWQEQDYIRHPDWGLPEFHSGKGAIRTHTDREGHTLIFQDVEAAPNASCAASVWVRAADLRGKGFGQHTNDSAGLVIWELDEWGKVVHKHDKVEVKTSGPYTRLSRRFTTGKSTAQVRFILDSVMHCPYQEGHVSYDDCSLVAEASAGATRR